MTDLATHLTELYVLIDTLDKAELPPEPAIGRPPALARSEVITLAILGQWARFPSERAFYAWAGRHLRPFFPTLPDRSQFNRLLRHQQAAITAVALALGVRLQRPEEPYEILDGTGVATRNSKRRGEGRLPQATNIGRCSRLGFFAGFRLLLCVTAQGVVTGWRHDPASTNERKVADAFLAERAASPTGGSAGQPVGAHDLADMGFSGAQWHAHWAQEYGAVVISPPQTGSKAAWDPKARRAHASQRQIVESVFGRLLLAFRLEHERPHTCEGFLARLAAKIALHHVCIGCNRQDETPDLALAHLIAW